MFEERQLDGYLRRIGVSGPLRADAESLRRIHRAHLATIPYENLDIQLGRTISLEPEALYRKVVESRRGGFCYEQNGTLALALRASGFTLTIVEGGVHREERGESAWGNHMLLLVEADGQRWIADAGLGDGFLEPLPLAEGEHRQGAFTHRLKRLDAETWRCFPDAHGSVGSFDFRLTPRKIEDFAGRCLELSTSPESSFVKVLTVQQPGEPCLARIRSRTFSTSGPTLSGGKTERFVTDRAEFETLLFDDFGLGRQTLNPSEVDTLWANATGQHETWLSTRAA
ncbi:arylamine N-acetyltransferase family protein [Stackebrandtia nassauensis]|uniref:N-acetyltransferase n=1 Tax=Stackebrandtia nassauensis (strain DSM 44728 / CIP 108903 / NRRL B-16338 / NBRC 102104 / LLR-40K-21) TaxID=446470 RepID=D3PUD5_STANL|nr:arylamine N-acetyltransferase [Stackebrandtia nassauensis]ADD42948.1 N-acetyltransferase [Stackebrandtia nassauensis DSM 44728]